jgi:hypothetical protein
MEFLRRWLKEAGVTEELKSTDPWLGWDDVHYVSSSREMIICDLIYS